VLSSPERSGERIAALAREAGLEVSSLDVSPAGVFAQFRRSQDKGAP